LGSETIVGKESTTAENDRNNRNDRKEAIMYSEYSNQWSLQLPNIHTEPSY
jgi:hypothetical protein